MAKAEFPEALQFLFTPARYKVAHGGRGSAKSWSYARALLIQGAQEPLRILCARETQMSINQSVHKLLCDQISELELGSFYKVTESSIRGKNGTEFSFCGIRQQGVHNIKSFEGVDRCWVEEAQTVTKQSWDILVPTIRKPGSEIWISFNPDLEDDETYQRFVVSPPDGAIVKRVNWQDNPWFPLVLRAEKDDLAQRDPVAYENVWEGRCRTLAEGAVLFKEMQAAEAEGRIGVYPHDTTKPVYLAFDIGVGDPTCIWYAQKQPNGRWRFIDYTMDTDEGLPFYARLWARKNYLYGGYWCPHDAKQREWGTGKTPKEIAAGLGINFSDVPNLSIEDRVSAAKQFIEQCEFDAEHCVEGLRGLRNWRWDMNVRLNERKNRPLHNWASHPGDAFSYFAVASDLMMPPCAISFVNNASQGEYA